MNKKHLFLTLILSSCCCMQNTFAMKQPQQSIQQEQLNSELIKAADQGNVKRVKDLISKGADVNAKDNFDQTPLHLAVEYGYLEIVRLLLDNKADINAKTKEGFTPLQLAVKKGHPEVVRLLLDNKADINTKDKEGFTLLHLAAEAGHPEVVQLLLDYKADINAQVKESYTPLHFAAQKGHLEVVRLLLDNKADTNAQDKEGFTPLLFAVQVGRTKIVQYLITKEADVNAEIRGYTLLHAAAALGHLEIVRLLLNNKAEINTKDKEGTTPLDLAAQEGYSAICDLLQKKDAVSVAFKNKNFQALRDMLLKNHEYVYLHATFDDDNTPLHIAAEAGQVKIAEYLLLQIGVDIDAQNANGDTPLHLACQNKQTDIVKRLINKNANKTLKNKKGETPLDIAQNNNSSPIIEALTGVAANTTIAQQPAQQAIDLDKARKDVETAFQNKNFTTGIKKLIYNKNTPIDVNKTIDGNTYLHIAAQAGQPNISQNLIERGANINAQNENGDTPLHLACQNNMAPDVVKVLIEKKANPNIKNKDGKIPLDLVKSRTQNKGTATIIGLLTANQATAQAPVILPASSLSATQSSPPLSLSSSSNNAVAQASITPLIPKKLLTFNQIKEIVTDTYSLFGTTDFENHKLRIIHKLESDGYDTEDLQLDEFIHRALEKLQTRSSSSSSSTDAKAPKARKSTASPAIPQKNTLSHKEKRHFNPFPPSSPAKPLAKSLQTECPICFEDFTQQEQVLQLNCGHIFCTRIDCYNYLHTAGTLCPICRGLITSIKNIMYLLPQNTSNVTASTEKLKEKEHVFENNDQQKTEGTPISYNYDVTFSCGHTLHLLNDLQGKSFDDKSLCPNCQNKK